MNCRGLAKVLPELVAGELDERIVRKAEEHIRVCPLCASERAAYEEALSALSVTRPMVEVPDALATLELPEVYARKTWLRPVFASAAMAAILALVMILPRTHQALAPTVKAPRIAETIEHPRLGPEKPNARIEIAQSISRAGTEHKTHASKTRSGRASLLADARLGLSDVPTQPRHAENRYAADRVAEAVSSEKNQVLVIATDVEPLSEPSAMSIESKDGSTGVLVAYDFSRDDAGTEQVMELTTNYVPGESGGD